MQFLFKSLIEFNLILSSFSPKYVKQLKKNKTVRGVSKHCEEMGTERDADLMKYLNKDFSSSFK